VPFCKMVLGAAEMAEMRPHVDRSIRHTVKRSKSATALLRSATLSNPFGEQQAAAPQQVNCNYRGAPKFSFGPGKGKPRHLAGKIGIEVIDPRSNDYVPGHTLAPGPGHYEYQQTVGRHDLQREFLHAHQEKVEKTGHPQHSRAPGYAWGDRTEDRDRMAKRYTQLSHVRSDSYLDNTGAGQYLGCDEKVCIMRRQPAYTMRRKCSQGPCARNNPPIPGPFEYDTRHKKDVIQLKKPGWTVGHEQRTSIGLQESWGPGRQQHAVTKHMGTPDDIGPGRYAHSTCLVSQY